MWHRNFTARVERVIDKCQKLRIGKYVNVSSEGRAIIFEVDRDRLAERTKLDGCYVLKSNVPTGEASAKTILDRYKAS
ncbi:MAG: hypothetical protein NUW37_04780 [Planctomycetes bacterium]|nr:hypothetical protein [Planctomycetota bacterium]